MNWCKETLESYFLMDRRLIYICILLMQLFFTSCSIQQRVKRADKKFAIGEYFIAADMYKQCYSRL